MMMRKLSWAVLVMAGLSGGLLMTAADDYRFPQARIPHVGDNPPVLDGVIGTDEYRHCAAIGGMVAWGGAGGTNKSVVPDIQQVVWFLGYDDDFFYIAMRSPNPPGIWPLAKVKAHGQSHRILWDDHVEIQIAKDRNQARTHEYGFFKVMANARGFYSDEHYFSGTDGEEHNWSIRGEVKSTVTPEHWDLEIKIGREAFEVDSFAGQRWVLQLLRADGCGDSIYFAGWAGESWQSWGRFGEVVFDPEAPVFRMLSVGDLARGAMDINLELTGQTVVAVPVDVQVRVTDGDGQERYSHRSTESVTRGAVQNLHLRGDVPLTARGNRLEIVARYTDPQGESRTLYHVQSPIVLHDQAFWEDHIAPWLERRSAADFDWSFAYWAGHGVAESKVDVDFFGIDEALGNASSFEVEIQRRGDGQKLGGGRAEINPETKLGSMQLPHLDLPEGEYVARVRLFGADGRQVVGEREMEFVRRHYPWEGNTLGVSDQVIPPFSPIEMDDADGHHFHVWARRYSLGPDGLLSRIRAGGGAGHEDILRSPMRLTAARGDETILPANVGYEIKKVGPGRVDIGASGQLGGAALRVNAHLEYDGWYQVDVILEPREGPVAFDRLFLDIPLWPDADTMYVQRYGDSIRGNRFGDIPAGRGMVWSSSELVPLPQGDDPEGIWGSFTPITYVGTGDKGLWLLMEENRDWAMSDERAAVEVFRADDGIDLRVNFLACPATLDRARRFTFAILVDPVKQMANERRWAWGRLPYAHSTFGFRYYGGSVDGYEMEQADRDALRAVLTDPDWRRPEGCDWSNNAAFRNRYLEAVGRRRLMLTLYGSTSMTGMGLPEFDTYGGEWLGRTNWTTSPHTSFRGRWNHQGTKRWESDRDLSVCVVNFNRTYEDCFVWHHRLMLRDVPVNGTWWDNRSIRIIREYDPQTQSFYRHWNVFSRRRLSKRLAHVGWELGRRPWWINNMHVDWSFNQVSWHIENDFSARPTVMEFYSSMAQFRALTRIKRGIIHRLSMASHGETNAAKALSGRSIAGMALLHDIGSVRRGDGPHIAAMLELLDTTVGFFDDAEFLPYWRNRHLIALDTPEVYASIYRGHGRAVMVVVNRMPEDRQVAYRLNPMVLAGSVVTRIRDGETGAVFASPEGETEPGTFHLPAVGIRLLVIE